MTLGNCKLKWWDTTTHPLEWLKSWKTENTKCWQGCGATGTPHSLLVGMHKDTATLEDNLAVSYKIKYSLTKWSSNDTPSYLAKWVENVWSHKSLHMNAYSNFTYNCQKLEATEMSSKRWMDNRGIINYIHTHANTHNGYYTDNILNSEI